MPVAPHPDSFGPPPRPGDKPIAVAAGCRARAGGCRGTNITIKNENPKLFAAIRFGVTNSASRGTKNPAARPRKRARGNTGTAGNAIPHLIGIQTGDVVQMPRHEAEPPLGSEQE